MDENNKDIDETKYIKLRQRKREKKEKWTQK